MAEEALVEALILESVKLVEQLDAQGDKLTNVLWYFSSDHEAWRLLVAGPTFDRLLPQDETEAYLRLGKALFSLDLWSLSISDVIPARTDDPLMEATKDLVRTSPTDTIRAHFGARMFNGLFVKEMLILRAVSPTVETPPEGRV